MFLKKFGKFNATFDGELKKYTECNRPKLDQPTKIFLVLLLACIQSIINLILITLIAVKNQHTPPTQTPSTDGKNSSVSVSTLLIIGIMVFLFVLLAIIISLDPKEPGRVEERKRQLQSAVKSLTSRSQGGAIEVWGDGLQTRSFLFIDECIEATRRLMDSDFQGPVNIGSEEMVTINQLVETAAKVSGKTVAKIHIDGPLGVRGRNSNNDLIREKLGWDYSQSLEEGIFKTYYWIKSQIEVKDAVEV